MKKLYSLIHTLAKNMTAAMSVILSHMAAYSRMSFKTRLFITLPLIGPTGYYHSLGKSLAREEFGSPYSVSASVQ